MPLFVFSFNPTRLIHLCSLCRFAARILPILDVRLSPASVAACLLPAAACYALPLFRSYPQEEGLAPDHSYCVNEITRHFMSAFDHLRQIRSMLYWRERAARRSFRVVPALKTELA